MNTDQEPSGYQCSACGFTRQSSRGVKSHIGHKQNQNNGYGRRDNGHDEDTHPIPLYKETEDDTPNVWKADCPFCEETIQDREVFEKHVKNCRRQPESKAETRREL